MTRILNKDDLQTIEHYWLPLLIIEERRINGTRNALKLWISAVEYMIEIRGALKPLSDMMQSSGKADTRFTLSTEVKLTDGRTVYRDSDGNLCSL